MTKRLILAGFVSLSSSCLIIFGAKGWRSRSVLFSAFLTACLISLVFVMPIHSLPTTGIWADDNEQGGRPSSRKLPSSDDSDDESGVKKRVDYTPMQREIDKLTNKAKGIDGLSMVTGIFIEDIREIELLEVEQYLQRKLGLPKTEAPAAYQRNGGKDRFIVFSGIAQRFESFVGHCESLGEVKTYPEDRVIEIKLNKDLFADPSPEVFRQMTHPTNPSFFLVNLEQLNHVSLGRVKQAVKRLANLPKGVEAREMPRMKEELVRLLREESDPELIDNIGQALQVWAKGDKEIVATVGLIVSKWSQEGRPIASSLVGFLAENGSEEAALVIDRLWAKSPEIWSEHYISLGSVVEDRLLSHLENSPEELKKSALVILRKIGTKKSLLTLDRFKVHENDEIQILAVRAISAVKLRK